MNSYFKKFASKENLILILFYYISMGLFLINTGFYYMHLSYGDMEHSFSPMFPYVNRRYTITSEIWYKRPAPATC